MDRVVIYCVSILLWYPSGTDQSRSTKLDVEKHLALQEEKLELESKLLEV